MILTNLFYYCIPLTSVMFASQLELAGATLSSSWAVVTGFALMIGLSGALETLCGQGFGAKTSKSGLGFVGAPIATSISLWIAFLSLGTYVICSDKFKETWTGFSLESFRYIVLNLKLSITSAVMLCLEYWAAFEILVFLAGVMPNPEINTSLVAICVNTETISYMLTYGLSAAASTLLSNELGAENVKGTKKETPVSLKLSLILALGVVIALLVGLDAWVRLFTNSLVAKEKFASLKFFLVASLTIDSIQGIARGCGWQRLVMVINLGTFYLIGMPIAVLCGFKFKLYAKGLWIGLICGLFCQSSSLLLMTIFRKWTKLNATV